MVCLSYNGRLDFFFHYTSAPALLSSLFFSFLFLAVGSIALAGFEPLGFSDWAVSTSLVAGDCRYAPLW